jgi:asparagine synthase (glutamine-hydrolysing)
VDSGALVGLMRDAGQSEIRTVTLAYDEFRGLPGDEAPLAAETARRYETKHTTRYVSADEFHTDLPRILAAMDQPSIDGINTWFVSKAAHELGLKVAISGVGGDELLGGYSTFHSLPRIAAWTRISLGLRALSGLLEGSVGVARWLGLRIHPKWAGVLRYGGNLSGAYLLQRGLFLPSEMRVALNEPEFVRDGLERLRPLELITKALSGEPRSTHGQVAALESCLYLRNQLLRDTDWAGMAHSLEIRTPLVDHVLLRRAAVVMTAPQRPSGKHMLAHAPRTPLPEAIVNRAKSGFGIPVQAWLSQRTPGEPIPGARDAVFSRAWAHQIACLQEALPRPSTRAIDAA